MARHEQAIIKLGLLASTIAALTLGCVLDLDKLDAGQDDSADDPETGGDPSEALECLIGTEIDATGVDQSTFEPGCEVTCDDGWGHDADALPIAWTSAVEAYPEPEARPDATSAANPAFWSSCGFDLAIDDPRFPVVRREL